MASRLTVESFPWSYPLSLDVAWWLFLQLGLPDRLRGHYVWEIRRGASHLSIHRRVPHGHAAGTSAPGSEYESSPVVTSWPRHWCHALDLAAVLSRDAVGGGSGAAQARRHPARARV